MKTTKIGFKKLIVLHKWKRIEIGSRRKRLKGNKKTSNIRQKTTRKRCKGRYNNKEHGDE